MNLICKKCGNEKTKYKDFSLKKGFRYRCPICKSNYQKEYRKENLEHCKQIEKASYWRHHEKRLKQNRENRLKNYEHNLKREKKQRDKRKEYIQEYSSQWKKKNKLKVRFYAYERRKYGDTRNVKEEDIKEKLLEQNYKCIYCGKDIRGNYTIDHKIPLSREGTNLKENIDLACLNCNSSKNNKTKEEFLEYLKIIKKK